MKIQTKVWEFISVKQKETIDNKTYLHVPICIGFKKQILNEAFKAMMKDIKEHQKHNEGLSFAVVIYNNVDNEAKVQKWMTDNAETIAELGNCFFTIQQWREKRSEAIAKADRQYEALRKGPKAEKIQSIIQDDVQRFTSENNVDKGVSE